MKRRKGIMMRRMVLAGGVLALGFGSCLGWGAEGDVAWESSVAVPAAMAGRWDAMAFDGQGRAHHWRRFQEPGRGAEILRWEDANGDGVADRGTVAVEVAAPLGDGRASSLCFCEGDLYALVEAELWRWRDEDRDGEFDGNRRLVYGELVAGKSSRDFQAFRDLQCGPDGWLYWLVDDRGLTVKGVDEASHHLPWDGAVLRCDAEGRQLGVFARGFRDPRALAFDEAGTSGSPTRTCWTRAWRTRATRCTGSCRDRMPVGDLF